MPELWAAHLAWSGFIDQQQGPSIHLSNPKWYKSHRRPATRQRPKWRDYRIIPVLPANETGSKNQEHGLSKAKQCPHAWNFPKSFPMTSEQDRSPFLESISMYKVKELASVQRPERKLCNFKHNAPAPCGGYLSSWWHLSSQLVACDLPSSLRVLKNFGVPFIPAHTRPGYMSRSE